MACDGQGTKLVRCCCCCCCAVLPISPSVASFQSSSPGLGLIREWENQLCPVDHVCMCLLNIYIQMYICIKLDGRRYIIQHDAHIISKRVKIYCFKKSRTLKSCLYTHYIYRKRE